MDMNGMVFALDKYGVRPLGAMTDDPNLVMLAKTEPPGKRERGVTRSRNLGDGNWRQKLYRFIGILNHHFP